MHLTPRLAAALSLVWLALPGAALPSGPGPPSLQVRIEMDEAEAALAILAERRETGTVKAESWDRLWKSQGFTRLKRRQESFGATEVEMGFREFLTSEEPLTRLDALRTAAEAWKHLDASAAGRRAAAYLPAGLRLRATIYPVIKRSDNSFVFEVATDPAIFFYVDPKSTPAQLENTLAHELHHVGLAGCPQPPDVGKLPAARQRVFRDLGAFGEGLAVLAAAGSPDVHPHATSSPEAWAVWERDVANFNADLRRIESFFRDILAGRLSEEEENKRLFTFINTEDVPQGAFYTVGWKMAALIERTRGRQALLATVCDPRALLATYNEIAAAHPRRGDRDGEGLARWSPEFLESLRDHSQ